MKLTSEYKLDEKKVDTIAEKWEKWGLLQGVRQPEQLALLLEDYTKALLREREMFRSSSEEEQENTFVEDVSAIAYPLVVHMWRMLEENFSEIKTMNFPVLLVEDGSRNQYVMKSRFFEGPSLMWDPEEFEKRLNPTPSNEVDVEAEMVSYNAGILRKFFEQKIKDKLLSECWVHYPIISPSNDKGSFKLNLRFGFLTE